MNEADEPMWRIFPRKGGFIIGYKTNARFSDAGVMTIGKPGGAPLYAFPDEEQIFPTEAEAQAAIDKLEKGNARNSRKGGKGDQEVEP